MTRNILIIDDDTVFAQTLALAMSRRGYETVAAENGQ
jgi:ActR/RegA family two-component response regulator